MTITSGLTPIIPWMGGKRRLADQILPLFPKHDCYVELFFGGGALYFMKPYQVKCEVINDMNGELVNLYRVVQNHLEEFVRQFKWAISSRQVFKWQQMTNPETLTDIQRAARFYYLQHHAFGGKVSGQSYGTATTAPMVNLLRIEEQLSAAHLRLSGTTIEHLSWDECFKRYEREHTFFYADPPYWDVAGYGVDFGFEQYEKMAQLMATTNSKFMVSINDHPAIREVFQNMFLKEVFLKYTVGGGDKATDVRELVFTNWDTERNVHNDQGTLF